MGIRSCAWSLALALPWFGWPCQHSNDAGMPDAGMPDAGTTDAGMPDAGATDAGAVDAGPHSCAIPESAPAPFVSATTINGWPGIGQLANLTPTGRDPLPGYGGDGYGSSTVRSDAENRLYAPLPASRIAAVNPYRGLLVIDASDAAAPHVSAELPEIGWPSSLLGRSGDLLIVGGIDVNNSLSTVFAVDVSQPDHPRISARSPLPGRFLINDLLQPNLDEWHGVASYSAGSSLVLYVVTTLPSIDPATGNSVQDIRVSSLRASGGGLEAVSQLNVAPGDLLATALATANGLVLVTQNADDGLQTLRAVATGGASGSLTLGGELALDGYSTRADVDVQAGIARLVASVTALDGSTQLHVQTFDARDPFALHAVGDCPIAGSGQPGPRFLPDRLLFQTAIDVDPFLAYQAVSVDPEGQCAVFLDYGSPNLPDSLQLTRDSAGNDTRMLSLELGSDGITRYARLHDVSSSEHGLQLLAEVALPALLQSVAYQFWFDAIEEAVAISAPDGTPETGLMLVSWYEQRDPSVGPGVQLLTFSDHTLTLRGELDGVSSERAFALGATIRELSSRRYGDVNASDPDAPSRSGAAELAPYDYRLFAYGDYVARVRNPVRELIGTPNPLVETAVAQVDVVPAALDPQLGAAVASFTVPAAASLFQVGSLLVSVTSSQFFGAPVTSAEVAVYDLAHPTSPVQRGTTTAPELAFYRPVSEQPVNCGRTPRCTPRNWPDAFALQDALVLIENAPASAAPVLHVIDLRDPTAPVVLPPIALGCAGITVGAFAQGQSVYHVLMRSIPASSTDSRARSAYYLTQLDVSDPGHPLLSASINVPGLPFGTDAEHVYSVEYALAADPAVSSLGLQVHAFSIAGGDVVLEQTRTLDGAAITGIARAPSGQLLIGHWPSFASGDTHGDVVALDASDLSERGRAAGELWWPRPRCTDSDLLVLEDFTHIHVIDTTATGTLPTAEAYTGPIQWRAPLDGRSLQCSNDEVLWAHGRYGAGRVVRPTP
jgi:hypothetical protein